LFLSFYFNLILLLYQKIRLLVSAVSYLCLRFCASPHYLNISWLHSLISKFTKFHVIRNFPSLLTENFYSRPKIAKKCFRYIVGCCVSIPFSI
jgi:hypothetical protein